VLIPQLDLEAEIVPGVGLGGFEVGQPIRAYEEVLRADDEAVVPRVHGLWQVVFRMTQIYVPADEEYHLSFDAMEEFHARKRAGLEASLDLAASFFERPESGPAIEVWVDVRDGIIDAITALPAYQGTLGALRAGMTLGEVCAADARVEAPDFLDETTIAGVEGVRLWFEPADPAAPADRPDARLEGIVVFDPSRSGDGIKPY
jgi:hypothetical protein